MTFVNGVKKAGLLFYVFLMACSQHVELMQADKAAEANTKLGLAYLERDDYPRAHRKLLLALKIAPNSVNAHAAMGYFLEKTGQNKKAEEYYLQTIKLSPHDSAQKNNYGIFLCHIGQHKKAISYLLQAAGDIQYSNSGLAYENAGICAELKGDTKNSMIYFTRALQRNPKLKFALYEFVKLALKTGKEIEAIKQLEQHAILAKNDAHILALGIKAAAAVKNYSLIDKYQKQLDACTAHLTFASQN